MDGEGVDGDGLGQNIEVITAGGFVNRVLFHINETRSQNSLRKEVANTYIKNNSFLHHKTYSRYWF